MIKLFKWLRPACVLLGLFTILFGLIYPVVITVIAQVVFPLQANGSIIQDHRVAIGSSLIGQSFTDPKYFWSRPSATAPSPYNGLSSSGSNLGPTNPAFIDEVKKRIDVLRKVDPENKMPIPVDLVTASGSGLDPHISPEAALYQVGRIARMRHIPKNILNDLVNRHIEGRFLGIFGEKRINGLKLNVALDGLK